MSAGGQVQGSGQSYVFPESDDTYDFLFKVVLIGDAGVGKTCVVQRFKHGIYVERHGNTIGVDFMLKTVEVDGRRIKVRSRFIDFSTDVGKYILIADYISLYYL